MILIQLSHQRAPKLVSYKKYLGIQPINYRRKLINNIENRIILLTVINRKSINNIKIRINILTMINLIIKEDFQQNTFLIKKIKFKINCIQIMKIKKKLLEMSRY